MMHKEEIKYTLIGNYENESITCREHTDSKIVKNNPNAFNCLPRK